METLLDQRYRLEAEIARGAIGIVWRALDPASGERVAVKVLRPESAKLPDLVRALRAEADVLADLDHPSVIKVRGLTTVDGVPALVMDLAGGKDLRRRVRAGGPLAPALIADLGARVAEALAYLHRRGIVHGDVKASNILLLGGDLPGDRPVVSPEIRLVDFGIARSVDEAAGEIHATPEYAAPEVGAGTQPGTAADVYALGILLYELACGRTPFSGAEPVVVLGRHITAVAVPPPGMPAELWSVIEGCLRREPAARPEAGTVADHLRAVKPALTGFAALPELPAGAVTWWPRAIDETAPLPVLPARVDWVPLAPVPVSPASGYLGHLVAVPADRSPHLPSPGVPGASVRETARTRRRSGGLVIGGLAASLVVLIAIIGLLLTDRALSRQESPGGRPDAGGGSGASAGPVSGRSARAVPDAPGGVKETSAPDNANQNSSPVGFHGTKGDERNKPTETGDGADGPTATGDEGDGPSTPANEGRDSSTPGGLPGIGDPMPTMPGLPDQ